MDEVVAAIESGSVCILLVADKLGIFTIAFGFSFV